jgi:TolB protein
VIDSEGRNERVVASERGDCRPAWAPDGRSIAFVSVRADGKGDVFVLADDGAGPRRVTTDDQLYDYHPAWSPDGSRLAIASGPSKRRYKLFLIDADGRNRRQLTFGDSLDTHPAWTR